VASLRIATPARISRINALSLGRWALPWLALGALLVVVAYQIPARHTVTIGVNDGAYVQGFEDATNRWGVLTDRTGMSSPYRWSGASSAILFPQIGLPARATIRIRGWRPAGEEPPQVRVLLNGRDLLQTITTTPEWQEYSFPVASGVWKAQDVFLQLDATRLTSGTRGVQVNYAALETVGWPITPYPAQVMGGALATFLTAALVRRRRVALAVAGVLALGFALHRVGVLPLPVRSYWLPVCGVLGVATIARSVVRPVALNAAGVWWSTRVFDGVAVGIIALWCAVVARAARAHVVLSLPGVEKDFRVFATRSDAWWCLPGAFDPSANCVWRADGFYQLGYPALLWALRPLTSDNPFLAAQVVALVCGAILLGATYVLGRLLLGPLPALLALLFVALNRWTVSYSLFLGTDMPFAAACAVALVALLWMRGRPARAVAAGMACGVAFAIRHPGVVLVPLGMVWLWYGWRTFASAALSWRRWLLLSTLLVAGFAAASAPQIVVNLLDTGNPLYSQQAKNIWLAVYGNTDWNRWGEARDDIALSDVILHDPARFMANWWGNVRAFWGTGAEDTTEFGRALGLRLLAFPANLLAIAGVVIAIARGDRALRWLVAVAAVSIGAIAVGFMLPRFCLPLVPVAAILAAEALRRGWQHGAIASSTVARQGFVAACCVVVLLAAGSVGAGEREVLRNQDADAVQAVALVERTLGPTDRLIATLPADDFLAKYGAIAHRADADPSQPPRFALYTDDGADATLPRGELVGRAGRYRLDRIVP
jgi:hypothetical protein